MSHLYTRMIYLFILNHRDRHFILRSAASVVQLIIPKMVWGCFSLNPSICDVNVTAFCNWYLIV